MKILGIDPGIGRTGWGIVEVVNNRWQMESCGCIETKANTPLKERLLTLFYELIHIIEENHPDVIVIEELFFNTNAKTALVVGQARGIVLLVAGLNGLELEEYTPLQVKISLTGYGRAEKNQIGQMVKTILKLPSVPKPDDTADALAIALTHAFSYKTKKLSI